MGPLEGRELCWAAVLALWPAAEGVRTTETARELHEIVRGLADLIVK